MKAIPSTIPGFDGMNFFPVAAREARIAARRSRLYHIRLAVAGIFFLITYLRLTTKPLPLTIGGPLFQTLSTVGYAYCLFAGALRTFDTLSSEKREGTLGLLLLTDLRPFQILFGKLLSATAVTFFGLLAMLPALTAPFLIGGTTLEQFTLTCLSLLTTLLLSISWGLLISAVVRKYLVGLTLAVAMPILFGLIPIRLIETLNPSDPATFPTTLLSVLASPALLLQLARATDPNLSQFFWPALFFNVTLAGSWLLLARYLFPRCWQETPKDSRWLQAIRNALHNWRFGNAIQRAAFRERLLNENPLFWLAHRDRVSSTGLIALCICILMLSQYFKAPNLGLILASLTILYRMAHAASQSISEDQKTGALELLLSSTLTVGEIIAGLNEAMLRRFLGPVIIVILWPWLFMGGNALVFCSSILLIATWITLSWAGLWFALRKQPTAAAWTTLAVVALPPWLIWIASILPYVFNPLFADVRVFGATVCCFVGMFHCVLVTRWAHDILKKNFRTAAADPFGKIAFEPAFGPPSNGSGPGSVVVVPIGKGVVKIIAGATKSSATLMAVPAENQSFLEWAGDIRGNENPLHLELQGRAFIYAKFSDHA